METIDLVVAVFWSVLFLVGLLEIKLQPPSSLPNEVLVMADALERVLFFECLGPLEVLGRGH